MIDRLFQGVMFLVAIFGWFLLMMLALISWSIYASSHEWYDPWCCNDKDCQRISPNEVVAGSKGYTVGGKFFVPYLDKAIKPSQDADYHFCEYPVGTVRCFYVPGGGV